MIMIYKTKLNTSLYQSQIFKLKKHFAAIEVIKQLLLKQTCAEIQDIFIKYDPFQTI